MAQEPFSTYVGGLPAANLPLAGTELFPLTQLGVSSFLTFSNIVGQVAPAWSSYSPTISASSGSLVSASAAGRYIHIGKLVFFEVTGTITTNGSGVGGTAGGTGAIILSVPITALRGIANDVPNVHGREVGGISNKQLAASWNDSTHIIVFNFDGTYPGVPNRGPVILSLAGVYEST